MSLGPVEQAFLGKLGESVRSAKTRVPEECRTGCWQAEADFKALAKMFEDLAWAEQSPEHTFAGELHKAGYRAETSVYHRDQHHKYTLRRRGERLFNICCETEINAQLLETLGAVTIPANCRETCGLVMRYLAYRTIAENR